MYVGMSCRHLSIGLVRRTKTLTASVCNLADNRFAGVIAKTLSNVLPRSVLACGLETIKTVAVQCKFRFTFQTFRFDDSIPRRESKLAGGGVSRLT